MDDKTYLIQNRFPDKNKTIVVLIEEDPDFRDMCEDYDDCILALRYWEKSQEEEAESRVNEFKKLIHELEIEITEIIGKTVK